MKEIREETKKKLRAAKAQLKSAQCTCGDKHDPYWMRCPRALAEWEMDNVMEIVRWELSK